MAAASSTAAERGEIIARSEVAHASSRQQRKLPRALIKRDMVCCQAHSIGIGNYLFKCGRERANRGALLHKGVLANELGHKLVHDNGLWSVFPSDLGTVTVSGTLRLQENAHLRKLRRCTVAVRAQDAELAHSVVGKQHSLLTKDLRLNLCGVDVPCAGGSLDLVTYFNTKQNYGCLGRVKVELKVFSPKDFDARVTELKETLPARLAEERVVDPSLCAVLLVVTRVEAVGLGWGKPTLSASLCKKPDGGVNDWLDVVGTTQKKGRGRCKDTKPTLRTVINNMRWAKADDGKKVGWLKHFLHELNLDENHAEERAETCNRHLQSVGHPDRVEQKRVPGEAGKTPLVASKEAFRVLYDFF